MIDFSEYEHGQSVLAFSFIVPGGVTAYELSYVDAAQVEGLDNDHPVGGPLGVVNVAAVGLDHRMTIETFPVGDVIASGDLINLYYTFRTMATLAGTAGLLTFLVADPAFENVWNDATAEGDAQS